MTFDRLSQPTDWDYTRNHTPEKEFNFDDLTIDELNDRDAMFERMFPKTKIVEQNDVVKGADKCS